MRLLDFPSGTGARSRSVIPARLVVIVVALVTLAGACSSSNPPTPAAHTATFDGTHNLTHACVSDYDSNTDYFPQKVEPRFAKNFQIEYHRHYKVVRVRQPEPGGQPATYVLVQCGTPTPSLSGALKGAEVVQIPVRRMVAMSATHLPMLELLHAFDAVVAVSSVKYVVNPTIHQLVKEGKVAQVAVAQSLDAESVLAQRPDVVMTDGYPADVYDTLRKAGVDVVAVAEWLEPDALGRAEWLDYMAAFLNEEARADQVLPAKIAAYRSLARRVKAEVPSDERPSVFAGTQFQGTWVVPGGDSLTAGLIRDAGGNYVFSDNSESQSIKVDHETMLAKAGDADVWINAGPTWTKLADATAEDPRYGDFAAFRHDRVWNYGRIQTAAGGVDFFESAVMRPDELLADLVKIFHPELAPGHHLAFYRRLPTEG